MAPRVWQPWTAEEDEFLCAAIELVEPGNSTPSRWNAIARHVPGHTNKSCRKRWIGKLAARHVIGAWTAEEDLRLRNAVETYGKRWSLVATMVPKCNGDQCSKRWMERLDLSIDHSKWSPEQDQLLLNAVNELGSRWTKIAMFCFPQKTGSSVKNRSVYPF
ncbi:hypothetical protein GYMLUDRAFT_170441 [Collybiopsis luxurians FD-317 M1]|uniref:Uncharacterized protein n=1 Tax=Collybiopsis luxurians FD-317 M1 TaxID=944289 RepID=A0A0D0BU21_9AGAR|nr:hypothetical protein GYMLUDRAFT_170441 [Collybiopsis luxurians FD-317 M1]